MLNPNNRIEKLVEDLTAPGALPGRMITYQPDVILQIVEQMLDGDLKCIVGVHEKIKVGLLPKRFGIRRTVHDRFEIADQRIAGNGIVITPFKDNRVTTQGFRLDEHGNIVEVREGPLTYHYKSGGEFIECFHEVGDLPKGTRDLLNPLHAAMAPTTLGLAEVYLQCVILKGIRLAWTPKE